MAERHELGISVGILVRTGLENSRCLRYGNMDIIVGWEKLRLLAVGGMSRSGSLCTSRYFFSEGFFSKNLVIRLTFLRTSDGLLLGIMVAC